MSRPKPTGFVARCQCGECIGAMDYERTDRQDAGKILRDWLLGGYIIEPRFTGSWSVTLESCKCDERKGHD